MELMYYLYNSFSDFFNGNFPFEDDILNLYLIWKNELAVLEPGTPRPVHWVLLRAFTTHKTNGFTPHPKDETSWLSILLKDTSVTTGIQTHTLLIRNTRA